MPPVRYVNRKRKYYAGKYLTYKQRMEVQSMLKKYEKRNRDSKRYVASHVAGGVAGNGYICNPLAGITVGTGSTNRIGNTIQLNEIVVNCHWENVLTNGKSVELTMYCFWTDEEITTTPGFSTVTNASFAATLPLLGSTSGGQICNNVLDRNQTKGGFMKKFVIDSNSASTPNLVTFSKKFKFKGQALHYLTDSGTFLEKGNFYILIVSDSPGATVGTTTVSNPTVVYEIAYHE